MSDDELQSGFEIFVVTQHFGLRRRLWYVKTLLFMQNLDF